MYHSVTFLSVCVLLQVLLAHGAPVSVCNNAGENPCDVAAKARQPVIAKLLESKMVLSVSLN